MISSSALKVVLFLVSLPSCLVSALPGLSLKTTGPSYVSDVSELKVVTTLTNTGDESIKLLNDPRGSLNPFPANSFTITSDTGATPSFIGAKIKYVPATVIAKDLDSSFTVLNPGQSVDVSHDLSATYDFSTTGTGSYSFEASNLYHYVDPASGAAAPIFADVVAAHSLSLSGSLSPSQAVRRRSRILGKRASYVGCSASRQTSLVSAASAAQSYAAAANTYASSHTTSTTRYTTWFGTFTTARHTTVASHFSHLNSNTYSSYTYDCSTCTEEAYAYVFPDDFGTVYLCVDFWSAPTTGTDSKGGTLIHESSHFTSNGGTEDYAYGQSAAKSLASSNPGEAVFNADSHEYFAENNPTLA